MTKTLSTIEHQLISTMQSVDIDDNTKMAMQFGIRSIPTLVLVDDTGAEVRRLTGGSSQAKIVEFLG